MRQTVLAKVLTLALLFPISLNSAKPQGNETLDDKDMEVIAFQDMFYPPLAWTARLEGTVTVKVKLDDQGRVADASAISGQPAFTELCLRNVSAWLFKPNTAKTAVVVYNFRIIPGRCNTHSSMFVLQGKNLATVLACPLNPNPSASSAR